MKNNKGFSVIEGLLIMVILGIIGGTGWYVYNVQNKTTESLINADAANSSAVNYKTSKTTKPNITPDPTTGSWVAVTSGAKRFSIKVPDGWSFLNWTSRDYLQAYGYEDVSYNVSQPAKVIDQNGFVRDSGDPTRFSVNGGPISNKSVRAKPDASPTDFGPVSGVMGKKYIETFKIDKYGVKAGTKNYSYRFEGKTTFLVVDYWILPGETDQSATVEKAITTLEFK